MNSGSDSDSYKMEIENRILITCCLISLMLFLCVYSISKIFKCFCVFKKGNHGMRRKMKFGFANDDTDLSNSPPSIVVDSPEREEQQETLITN